MNKLNLEEFVTLLKKYETIINNSLDEEYKKSEPCEITMDMDMVFWDDGGFVISYTKYLQDCEINMKYFNGIEETVKSN